MQMVTTYIPLIREEQEYNRKIPAYNFQVQKPEGENFKKCKTNVCFESPAMSKKFQIYNKNNKFRQNYFGQQFLTL